jgi:uncharacterized protein YqgC (DUF456 family)
MDILFWLIVMAMVGIGIVGTILPAVPGVPLVFLGLLLGAWIDGFEKVGWITIGILFLLALAATIVDLLTTSYGAKRVGATPWAILGAGLGLLVGLWFGLPGLILGPFLMATLLEYIARRDILQAGRAGLGAWMGLVIGTAAKVSLSLTMIAVFLISYLV